jgi:uncharacterized membrane protein
VRTERLTAFSDGVIAVIITIMVLELKPPHEPDLAHLAGLAPAFLAYLLSFVYVGIYWNNHHHLFQAAPRVTGGGLWANLHLLFWMSLIPFATSWLDEDPHAALPTALYGVVLMMTSIAWLILQRFLLRADGDRRLGAALGRDRKGKVSPFLYIAGIVSAFVAPWLADAFYVAVALIWLVPDRRIERALADAPEA